MVSTLSAALALISAARWASAASVAGRQATGDAECRDVHIFLARGNNEPYPGRQGKLVTAICDGLDSCDYEDIQFYNPLPAPYCQSIVDGVANGTAQITAYNKRCPDAALVVSGYSQGAHVVGDVMGGGGGTFFQGCQQKPTPGMDATKAPGNKIAAVLLFGDTRHTANQPYNILGGAPDNGLFPRPANQLAGLMAFSKVARSYCADSDPICAGGKTAANHLNYFDIYSGDAGKWVQEMVGKPDTTTSSMPTSASPTTSVAPSAPAIPSISAPEIPSVSANPSGALSPASPTPVEPAPATPTAENAGSSSTTAESAATALACRSVLLGTAGLAALVVSGMI
ncbi:cutinase [Colletotrichum graminicola]|uniref:Cutinase n=1 Tax=Colletotrichum graminicola (strain M1.001 / M2 / FGSC 10212) TaxID=645133 RepID=E3QIP4_COLGM|nr:cutinase [Colletotrichum graminicola M1.001]EFQ30654.1 cutinase [Colletotrichum graminicola M1.001]WDK21384.1 cutinase [Colletotrichum graminicola]